jgi:hypothetical protein
LMRSQTKVRASTSIVSSSRRPTGDSLPRATAGGKLKGGSHDRSGRGANYRRHVVQAPSARLEGTCGTGRTGTTAGRPPLRDSLLAPRGTSTPGARRSA